ncbi:hypothetical protein D3C71_1667090 [compost metagenome]
MALHCSLYRTQEVELVSTQVSVAGNEGIKRGIDALFAVGQMNTLAQHVAQKVGQRCSRRFEGFAQSLFGDEEVGLIQRGADALQLFVT